MRIIQADLCVDEMIVERGYTIKLTNTNMGKTPSLKWRVGLYLHSSLLFLYFLKANKIFIV